MDHKTILLILFGLVLLIFLCSLIKNRPEHLILLGVRSLLSYILIQFINFVCNTAHLPVLVLANPITLTAGGLLGFPGILLLYAARLYFFTL